MAATYPTSTPELVDALVSRLETVLPPAAAAKGLPSVSEVLPYATCYPQADKAPQVWVEVVREDKSVPAGIGLGNPQARNRVVLVWVTGAGEDPRTAADQLRAYADLIAAVMEADQTAGGQGFRVQWISTEYGPNMAQSATALFQEAALTFHIPRWAPVGQD